MCIRRRNIHDRCDDVDVIKSETWYLSFCTCIILLFRLISKILNVFLLLNDIKFPSKLFFSMFYRDIRHHDDILMMHNAFLVARQSGKIMHSFPRFVLRAIKALDYSGIGKRTSRLENELRDWSRRKEARVFQADNNWKSNGKHGADMNLSRWFGNSRSIERIPLSR